MKNKTRNNFRQAFIFAFCLCALTTHVFAQANFSPGKCLTFEGTKQGGVWTTAAAEPCQQAINSLQAANDLVFGIKIKAPEETLSSWLSEMEYQPYRAKFDDGLKLGDAINFLKLKFAKANLRPYLDKVFDDVYGRQPTQAEIDYYSPRLKAQQETYTSMFMEESEKLKKNSAERKLMIDRAYQQAMGRNAKPEDISYWQARPQVFKEIINASRDWLYSRNGATDLTETFNRAYKAAGKKQLNQDEIRDLQSQFREWKSIYASMVKFFKNSTF